jgi:tricorn protease
MQWIPKQEWKQIFNDTWRRHRDFFYDKDMQKVDWNALRIRYGALIEDARTRWDVSFIQSNLNAELSAGHTYTSGGDAEPVTPILTGYLGIDWELSTTNTGLSEWCDRPCGIPKYAHRLITAAVQWPQVTTSCR